MEESTVPKPWKDAATVIVAASTDDFDPSGSGASRRESNFNYNILMLKRNSKSSFFPDAYVFPGGSLDDSDLSNEWMELFTRSGDAEGIKSLQDIEGKRPILFHPRKESQVPRELALRICAIREAFEECGLLIVKPSQSSYNNSIARWSDMRKCSKKIGRERMIEWRKRVQADASKFLDLCQSLECIPNVMALSEWTNWLTPTLERKRYNTAFFMCCMDVIPGPDMTPDHQEIVKSEWLSMPKIIEFGVSRKILLGPPQKYELGRIFNFKKFSDLSEFVQVRGKKGMECLFPVAMKTKDGIISLLPGDSLYPENPDLVNIDAETVDATGDESTRQCAHLNRFTYISKEVGSIVKIHCNIQPNYGHVAPVDLFVETGAKL
ncbi:acyl-coenzyme A diphosphatase NUDT19-like isoform X1 [Ptychodera flava]|uniref:acyl-coenzyme A diphosphatase NUDT19-like isoform X1 n=1 Tax=Ptychodera flava TaxID=63121 RepID=UPI00396A2043